MESANFHHHACYALPCSQNPILCRTNSTNIMVQDLGFTLNNNGTGSYPIQSFMTRELQHLGKTGSNPNFLQLLNCSPTISNLKDVHLHPNIKNDHHHHDFLLTNFCRPFKGGQYINDHKCCNESFSQIFPTINISSLNQSSSTSFDMNCLPASDIFGSPKFEESFSHAHNLVNLSHGLDRMHQPSNRPSVFPSKMSSVISTQSSKRPASKYIDDSKSKKSKLEPQVRKEKLRDKIAAIQQLVAPFGKTDTASVLMEAIGYIKFLQTQLQGLMEDGKKEPMRDLRSRGLCLVPLSYLPHVTDGGKGIWPVS